MGFSEQFYGAINKISDNMSVFDLKELIFRLTATVLFITLCAVLSCILPKGNGYRF